MFVNVDNGSIPIDSGMSRLIITLVNVVQILARKKPVGNTSCCFFQLCLLRTRWRCYLTPFQMNSGSSTQYLILWLVKNLWRLYIQIYSLAFIRDVRSQSNELWEYQLRYGIRWLKFTSFPIDVLVSTCSCCCRPPCHVVARSAKSNVKKRCNARNAMEQCESYLKARLSSISSFW